MAYLVLISDKAYIVSKGSACTAKELRQELATRCGIDKQDIVKTESYTTACSAETIAEYIHTDKEKVLVS